LCFLERHRDSNFEAGKGWDYLYVTPQHGLETIFDWRGYFGEKSVVIEVWKQMRRTGA
jgi:hypothetical protein